MLVTLSCLINQVVGQTITESGTAPPTNIIESVDRTPDVVAAPLATLFRAGAAANQLQHVGQSFQFASQFTISAVTIQYNTTVSGGAESFTYAAGQTMRLNITEDTNSDGTPDSIVTFQDFDMSGRTAQNFEYWTFTLSAPTATLDANKAYGFMFEWRTINGANIYRAEVDGTNTYANGGLLEQFNPTTLFPTPSATVDLTFYLQGTIIPVGPSVALSNSSVAPNAPPSSVVGNLSATNGATTTGWSFALAAGGDNDNFEITDVDVPNGTAILRTKVWLDAADFPYGISLTGTHPTDGDSPSTTGHSIGAAAGTSYVAFVASAGVDEGVAPVGGRLVATLDARDSDGTQIVAPNFSLVSGYGRTDLFGISGNELRLIAGEDPGAATTLHYVAIQAAGTADGYIVVEIEVGSAATVIRFR